MAEKRGVTIETSGDATPTVGSPALLQQMTTNLVHNAIVHNLPDGGTVWVTTSARSGPAVLTVENTGGQLSPAAGRHPRRAVPARHRARRAPTTRAWASAWPSSRASSDAHDGTLTLAPRPAGGLGVTVHLPAAPPSADQ